MLDHIGGPEITDMTGRTLTYTYPPGLGYTISFDQTHAYFTIPKHADGLDVIGSRYRARVIRPGSIYLTHWLVPGRTGHGALVFDLENHRVDGTGLMPGMMELFERATFDMQHENGENALDSR